MSKSEKIKKCVCEYCDFRCNNSYILKKHLSKKNSCKDNLATNLNYEKMKIINPIEITETIYIYRPKKIEDYLKDLMNGKVYDEEDEIINNKEMKINMSKMFSQEKYLDLIYKKLYEIGENIFQNVKHKENENVFSERVLIFPDDNFPIKKEKFKEFVQEYVINLLEKLFKNESICEDTVKINLNIKEITVLI